MTNIDIKLKDKIYNRDIIRREDITLDMLVQIKKISAEIVKLQGDAYLPIFIRIHEEVNKINEYNSYKELALKTIDKELD
jgi:hypothetical protein